MSDLQHFGFGNQKLTLRKLSTSLTDCFKTPTYDNRFTGYNERVISPFNSSDTNGPYRFYIRGNNSDYIDTRSMKLVVTLKCVQDDGVTTLAEEDKLKVSCANNIGSSIFSTAFVEINGKALPELTQSNYGYKAYFDTVLSYSPDALSTTLESKGFLPDQVNYFDKAIPADTDPKDLMITKRKQMINDPEGAQIITELHIDALQLDQLLPPNVNIMISLEKQDKAFYMIDGRAGAARKSDIQITNIQLLYKIRALHRDLMLEHKRLFDKDGAWKYHFFQNKIITSHVHSGVTEVRFDVIQGGHIPKQIVFGMIAADRFNGDMSLSPFKFEPFGANNISFQLNGRTLPSQPYTPNFTTKNYAREYNALMTVVGHDRKNSGGLIDFSRFGDGYTFFAYDFTPDSCNSFHSHELEQGWLAIDIKFATALTENVQIIAACTFEKMLLIDKNWEATVMHIP